MDYYYNVTTWSKIKAELEQKPDRWQISRHMTQSCESAEMGICAKPSALERIHAKLPHKEAF